MFPCSSPFSSFFNLSSGGLPGLDEKTLSGGGGEEPQSQEPPPPPKQGALWAEAERCLLSIPAPPPKSRALLARGVELSNKTPLRGGGGLMT